MRLSISFNHSCRNDITKRTLTSCRTIGNITYCVNTNLTLQFVNKLSSVLFFYNTSDRRLTFIYLPLYSRRKCRFIDHSIVQDLTGTRLWTGLFAKEIILSFSLVKMPFLTPFALSLIRQRKNRGLAEREKRNPSFRE